MHPFLLTSLSTFKKRIDKAADDNTNDQQILALVSEASGIADRYTKRKLRLRNYGTNGLGYEYGDGRGLDTYRAKQWPIYSVTSLYDDLNLEWGSDHLKPSTDYLIHIDRGEIQLYPTAAKGRLFSIGHSNIRLEYDGGYGIFEVIAGVNDRIDFEETEASELTATVAEGLYSAIDLATAIDTALDAAGGSTYTTIYDFWDSKFAITSDVSGGANKFILLGLTGTNQYRSIFPGIGYSILADAATAAAQPADDSALGIPSDLEEAVIEIALRLFNITPGFGGDRFDKESNTQSGSHGQTETFNRNTLPRNAEATLKRYRRAEG